MKILHYYMHPMGYAALVTFALVVCLTIYTVVGGVLSFITHQVVTLKRAYTELTPTAPVLHVYTQSLIDNRAPELADLKKYAAAGNWASFNETIDGIIHTLRTQERHAPTRDALIGQFTLARLMAPLRA